MASTGTAAKILVAFMEEENKNGISADGNVPTLRTKLGPWNQHMTPMEWTTLASTCLLSQEVYTREPDGNYRVYLGGIRNTTRKSVNFESYEIIDCLPGGAVPASFGPLRHDGTRRVYFRQLDQVLASAGGPYESFMTYVAAQPRHISQLLEFSDLTEQTSSLVAQLIASETQLFCGTDGGLLNGSGTFGYIWGCSESGTKTGAGKGTVPGHEIGMSSTRTELCAIFAALSYVRLVQEYYRNSEPSPAMNCIVVCDIAKRHSNVWHNSRIMTSAQLGAAERTMTLKRHYATTQKRLR